MLRSFLPLILISIISFSSCNKPTGIKNAVINSDSAAVSFYKGDGSMDTVYKVLILRDKQQIEELASQVESGRTENYACGYDGSIHFFKNNAVLKAIDFRMNDEGCMHFSFTMDGKLYNTKLSPGAKKFLASLNKKQQ